VVKKKSRLLLLHQHPLLPPLHLPRLHLMLLLLLPLRLLLPPLRHLLLLPANKLLCTKEKATFGWLFLWALATGWPPPCHRSTLDLHPVGPAQWVCDADGGVHPP